MMVSTKGRYALRVLADMAEHRTDKYLPLKDIAERQGISEKYLESIVKSLVKGGVLVGLRGRGGGYRLGKSPDMITVMDVLNLTEGSVAPVNCLSENAAVCDRIAECRTIKMWSGLNKVISDYLSTYTISDLMRTPGECMDYII